MKAINLEVGSIIEVKLNFAEKLQVPTQVVINKTSNTFVWFNGNGLCRIKRDTIDKFPEIYKIISI